MSDGGDPWRARLRDALVAAAKRYPQIALDPRPSVQECAAQTYTVILVVPPLSGDAAACKVAIAQGKRVVVVDRELGSDDFTCFVGVDGDAIGEAARRQIDDLLGPAGGAIVEIRGPASSQSEALHAGFVKALRLAQKP
jgi:ABC-type sugar transport system substrate-binding protein